MLVVQREIKNKQTAERTGFGFVFHLVRGLGGAAGGEGGEVGLVLPGRSIRISISLETGAGAERDHGFTADSEKQHLAVLTSPVEGDGCSDDGDAPQDGHNRQNHGVAAQTPRSVNVTLL